MGFKHSEDEWCRLQLSPYLLPTSTASHNHSPGAICKKNFHKRETSSLLARTTPVPSLALMNIMNLRELIEKCSEESELEPNSSIVLSDIVVKGKIHHWEHFFLFLFGIQYSRYCRYKHVRIDEKYDDHYDKTTPTKRMLIPMIFYSTDLYLKKFLFFLIL